MSYQSSTSSSRLLIRFLFVTAGLTIASIVWLGWNIYSSYTVIKKVDARNNKSQKLSGQIVHFDEVLTMSARMATTTGDPRWEKRYRLFEPQLDKTIKEAISIAPGEYTGNFAIKTDKANIELVAMENRAFELVHQGLLEEARSILFSSKYERQKEIYAHGMNNYRVRIDNLMKENLRSAKNKMILGIAVILLIILLLSVSWIVVIKRLKERQELLQQSKDTLESRVRERTAELRYEIKERKQTEELLERRSHDLGKRVKELKCLYDISTLVNKLDVSLEEILQGTVDSIPLAWQYPEITCARITLDGQEYKTQNHRVTSWKQSSSITVQGKRSGLVEVCYLEKRLEIDEGPFFKEERNLINSIAEKLGSIAERIREKEKNKILEMQMRQAEKMGAMGQLASGVVHDLSNKLVPIIGFANIVIRKINPEERSILDYLDIITKEGEEAKSLLTQLLTFAKKTPGNPTVMCAHESIKEATKILKRTISKNIIIKKKLKANPSLIYAEKSQIHNALLNLGLNARDAMPEGGTLIYATKTIHLHEKNFDASLANLKAGAYLEIKVIDTGVGIDDGIIDNIFEPFFTTKEAGKGTGLGLASVYGAISKHNGDINVYSVAGKGTTFCLYLPLSTFESEQTKPERGPISGSGNILFVDDEESIGKYMCAFLTELGYSVTFCSSGIQAEKVFDMNHDSIDLVMLDMMMPDLDGKETFLRMKKIDPDIRAIIISGYSDQIINAQEAKSLGIIEWIQKPFDEQYLSKRIAEITTS